MAKFYTTEEFEALVRARVKPPAKVKHPPMTAAQCRARDRRQTEVHRGRGRENVVAFFGMRSARERVRGMAVAS